MSQEDLDVVRANIENFNRTGYLLEDAYHPELELRNLRESPLPGPYQGYEGLRRWSEDLREVMSEVWFEVEEMFEAPPGSVVVSRARLRGRALHTELEVDLPMTLVDWLRNGRIYRGQAFSDHAEALRVASQGE